mgnify:FL=1
MGKASISIAISGSYNASAVERAEKSLDRLAVKTAAAEGSMSKSWVEAGSKAAEAGGRIYSAGQQVADAGDTMTAGVTVPLAAIGTAATKTAIDFESSMSRVSGALNDPSANMEELRQLALDMGADTVFSASEAGAAMEELAKGGLTAADIKGGALKTTMDLAAAGSLQLAEAANVTVQAMGAFGLTADETGEAANALAGAAAASSADVSDLTQGLSQVSAQAHSAGWSIQDTTAVLGAFADAGIRGSDAGTSLKTMLQRLAAPTDKSAAMMESLGINVRDANGNMLDAAGVAGELQAKLSGLDSATRDAAIQTIFGADASRAALVMMNQGTDGIQRYTAATNDQTAAQRLADSQMGETERSIEEMNGAIETASIQVGSALAPAVTDAAEAVGGAADAFSQMDEGTQQTVIGFGLVAAAAGPVLSVTGRITKGVGSMVTAFGRAKQDVATYADALTTTNVASLKAYQGNEKLSKALEKNPAAKAAGGVQKYIDAVTEANTAQSRYNASVRDLEREQKKGSKANSELVESLQKEVSERKSAMDAAKGTVEGYKASATAAQASTTAVTAQSVAMKAASVAATGLKLALATIAPLAIIAGITALVGVFQEAKEHEDNLKAATEGLTAATEKGVSASNAGADALEGYGASAGAAKVDIDEMLESQAQLAQTISDTNTSASAQMAQLQQAYSTIQQYANHTDLANDAQARLRTAVDTVNDLCGTQIQVTDAANGKLADESGAIQDVTASLGSYIDQKMQQIQVDAQQHNLSALYQQQAENITALTQAQQAYNDKVGELGDRQAYTEQYMRMYTGATRELADAAYEGQLAIAAQESGLDDATAALNATNTAIDNVSSSMTAQAAIADGNALSMQNLVLSSSTVSTAMNAVGGDINDFATDLSNAGVSVESFRSLNDQQLTQLVASWDGTSQSIITTLDSMGIEMGDAGLNAATALANGMQSGTVNVDTATSILKAAATGDWSSVSSQMSSAGISLPQSVADGITANSFTASGATNTMLSMIALQLTGGDVPAAAQLLGHDIDQGLANGIANGTLSEEQAALLGEDVISKAKDTLESHSPSQAFYRIGSDVDAGLSNGISGNTDGPLSSIAQLGQQLIDRISGLPGDAQSTGSRASSGLSSGLAAGIGAVSSSARSLASSASSGVSGTPSDLSSKGRSASSNFASGIGSGVGSTRSNARSLASAASNMQNAGNSYGWGSHLASNFASGIRAGITWVSNAAWSIVSAAKRAMGFSVPEEGPWSGAEKGGETSGLHLAQNFASGMLKGEGTVSDAARRLASASYFEANGGGFSSGVRTVGYGAAQQDGGGDAEVMAMLGEMVNLLREIASKDTNAYIGVDAVSTALAQSSRITARGRGYAV